MKLKFLYLIFTVSSILLIVGCTDTSAIENTNEIEQVKEVAWAFVVQQGWNDRADEDWKRAKVNKTIANKDYELLDETYEEKEVLSVSFNDKENVVVSTPSILVDPITLKVIGYMLGE